VPYLPPEGASDKKKRGYRSYYRYYSYGEKKKESEDSMPEITEIELVNHRYPKFSISEDYRSVRTSILLSYADNPPKTIVFSSALPKEGKTVTAANMAVAFAQLKERVMLVDADMRKPRLHRIFNVKNVGGLSGYLTSKVPFDKAVQQTSIENIWLVPSGPVPPNPAELLNSKKMQVMMDELKKGFDVILIDTPPLQAVIDPVIAASMADATVMIVKAGETPEKPFLQSVEDLQRGQSRIMGVVFNELKLERGGYYSYAGYKYKYGRYGKYGE
jgi:capsular exopolysaccharide synthesis family protein